MLPNPEIPYISRAQATETQSSSHLLQVTVLRAHNIPRLKTVLGLRTKFYATVTYGATTRQTRSLQRGGNNHVEWNENIDVFAVQPHPQIAISLYAKRTTRKDILIGKQEIVCEPHRELDIIFGGADGHPRPPTEPAPVLTITVSVYASSSLTATVNTPSPPEDDPITEGGPTRPIVQSNTETMQTTAVSTSLSSLSRIDDLPIGSGTFERPVTEDQPEESRTTLHRAEEAIDTINTVNTWKSALNSIKWVMDTVSPIAALNPYSHLAWSLLSKIPETLLQQVRRDDNVQTLFEAIRDAFELAEEADTLRDIQPESKQAKILHEMLECVSKTAEFIESYARDVQVGKRTLKNLGGQVDEKVEDYRSSLVRLREKLLAHATVITEAIVLQTRDDVRKVGTQLTEHALGVELSAIIGELPYKGGWQFGDEKRCLPGTRVHFLDYIVQWVENRESERGLVLLGQAGTGKSSIAHEVARRFESKGLGSYFTFIRKEGSKDEAYKLFTTIARDLSDNYPAFSLALGKVIKHNSSLRRTRDRRTLFERLLLEPLTDLQLRDPILIVIDGLDESGDTIGKYGLHTFLAQRLVDLPPNLRILITSRPEDGIEPAFVDGPSVRTLYMDDARLAANTEQDIGMYLRNELPEDVFKDHGGKLAKASEGLFQWAAVACGFINSTASLGLSNNECIRRLLGHSRGRSGEGLLDNLYEQVLKEYFKSHEAQALFRTIMGQLFAAVEPLSIRSLIALRQHAPTSGPGSEDSDRVVKILRHLGSLLSNVTSFDQTRPIVPLHTSFRDFLTNKTSNEFYVDLADAHHQLANSCLGLMLDILKFNICNLESSYLANSDVPDLEFRISKCILPALSYACIYWGDHLKHLVFDHDVFMKLRLFLKTKFLFWLEVLSIKKSIGLAPRALSSLSIWLQREGSQTVPVKDLLGLVNDASAFVRYFGMVMARSAPHIYISALPFAPSSSRILNQYLYQFPRTLTLERGQLSHWPALEMTIPAHDAWVFHVAFSPDGQRIASASSNDTICVWDATTGEVVAGPFTGHTSSVRSVAFSPDGERIASASNDHTIRVWDATTAQVVAGPFLGHTNYVTCVTFSPDGQRIASASEDCTIRVWDATTAQVVAGPFTGHTSWVECVVFSPDGQHIASASIDRTIRVWDSTTGRVVAGPFTEHTKSVTSVAFMPDGQCIASGSSDGTIRIWDATTGRLVAGPFTGHTDRVTSVASSPDGQRIASTSGDRTIRVWDASTGQVVAGPFTGHTSWVRSVAFSPDGQRIASASDDCTIRVWDATIAQVVVGSFTQYTESVRSVAFSPDGQHLASASHDAKILLWNATTGQVIVGPFTGHTDWITSVAFSPDGRCIASASGDRTIRVWNASTGQVIAGPFTGHTDHVTSVAFSPDGRCVASASYDRTIRVWNASTGQLVVGPFTGHTDWVASVAFSPDGQRIASTSYDHTIRVWNASTGRVVADPFTGHTRPVRSIVFSPDGQRIASASEDETIRVWDARTGQLTAGPFTGHTDWVLSVAFSPDGQCIASASYDGTSCVWNATTGHLIAGPFAGHTSAGVNSVAFSPNGQHIASTSDDGTIRVWDVTTGQVEAGQSTGHVNWTRSVVLSPDGQHTASASDDCANHVVNIVAEDSKFHFTDQSLINGEGWICGEENELFLWIPDLHKRCLHRPSTVWAAGGHETRLDLSKFVHGSNWATVYDHTLLQ